VLGPVRQAGEDQHRRIGPPAEVIRHSAYLHAKLAPPVLRATILRGA
jgi:hypothetical protein